MMLRRPQALHKRVALAIFIIQSVLKEWNIDEKTVEESMAEIKKDDTRYGELEVVKAANA
jgi:hypothetical protein